MLPISTLTSASFERTRGSPGRHSWTKEPSGNNLTLEEWKQKFMGVIHKAEVDLLYACIGNDGQVDVIKDSMQGLKVGVGELLETLSLLVERLVKRYKKSAHKTNKYWEAALDDMKDRLEQEKRSKIVEVERRRRLQTEIKKLRNEIENQRKVIRNMNGSHGVQRTPETEQVATVNHRASSDIKESTLSAEPERLKISQKIQKPEMAKEAVLTPPDSHRQVATMANQKASESPTVQESSPMLMKSSPNTEKETRIKNKDNPETATFNNSMESRNSSPSLNSAQPTIPSLKERLRKRNLARLGSVSSANEASDAEDRKSVV